SLTILAVGWHHVGCGPGAIGRIGFFGVVLGPGCDVNRSGSACGHFPARLGILHPPDVPVRACNADHPGHQRRPTVTDGYVDGHEHAPSGGLYVRWRCGHSCTLGRRAVLTGLSDGTDYCGDYGVCRTVNGAVIPANERSY